MVDLNEDNYEAYKLLHEIKKQSRYGVYHFNNYVEPVVWVLTETLCVIASFGIPALITVKAIPYFITEFGFDFSSIITINVLTAISLSYFGSKKISKIMSNNILNRNYKKIRNDYNIDTNIDEDTLKDELINYEKNSNSLEDKKQQHLAYFSNEVKDMAIKEKIEFLKEQQEFWSMVAEKEKNSNSLLEQKSLQKVKK